MNKYHLHNSNRKNGKESIELALKKSIIVNPLHKVESTIPSRRSSNKDVIQRSKTIVNSVSTYEGFKKGKLIKCPLKNIRLGFESNEEEPKPKMKNKKKKSTLDFIEKLKEIETLTGNSDFLKQTNEEIDIASKQLEEIKKMLANKLEAVVSNKPVESIDHHRHQCSTLDKVDKQFQKMQKQYSNKTKIHYKSLQDFENLMQSQNVLVDDRRNSNTKIIDQDSAQHMTKEKVYHPVDKKFNIKKQAGDRTENISKKFFLLKEKISQRGRWIQEVRNQWSSNEQKIPLSKTEDLEDFEEDSWKRKSSSFAHKRKLLRSVRFEVQSESSSDLNSLDETEVIMECEDPKDIPQKCSLPVINKDHPKSKTVKDAQTNMNDEIRNTSKPTFSRNNSNKAETSSATNKPRFQTINEYISYLEDINSSEQVKKDISKSKVLFKDEDFPFSEDEIEYNSDGNRNKISLPIVDNEKNISPLRDWFNADMKLKESVSKSDYLSREFSIDFKSKFSEVDKDKVIEKRCMQLLETTQRKFRNQQSCQLGNVKGRDRKLYTTLNITLKDTLFSGIEQ